MPPKDTAKKVAPAIIRPSISESSLFYVPNDVLEGFQERIETGIDWTLTELAARHHRQRCSDQEIPTLPFSAALKTKIENSIFGGFLNEKSNITLEQQWELFLPITLWDNDKFANEEGQVCFRNANSITDDMVKLIKKAVKAGDRKLLKKEIKMVEVLRVIDAKMTELDKGLTNFKKLISLNLCGNYIDVLDASLIPATVKSIELQANRIKFVEDFAHHLPQELLYLGLSKNFLNDGSVEALVRLPQFLTVLDLAENDIYDLEPVLDAVVRLPNLTSLMLAGNPCSVCAGYARTTLMRLPNLQWLDSREILPTDRSEEPFEPHPDDLRAAYFNFTIFRVMSAPQPPKPEKGAITTFHVELEIPLLDSIRRQFLMFRRNESLQEMMPPPEDDWSEGQKGPSLNMSKTKYRSTHGHEVANMEEASSHESDVYKVLTVKNSREIFHFKTFESNRVQWNKVMNFTEPSVRIFCPDLEALRNTFRTTMTLRLVYSLTPVAKLPKEKDKKSSSSFKVSGEQQVVLASIKCSLKRPDWSQASQHFHWDDSLITNEAIHWGDGDLSVLQYSQSPAKITKGKTGESAIDSRQLPPDNLTCHFGFGIETLRAL